MFDLYDLYSEAGHSAARINDEASRERDRLESVIYAGTGIVPSMGAGYAESGELVVQVFLRATVNGNGVCVAYRDDTREVSVTVNGGPIMPRDRKAGTIFRKASTMAETFHHYIDAYASAERARRERFGQPMHPWFPVL